MNLYRTYSRRINKKNREQIFKSVPDSYLCFNNGISRLQWESHTEVDIRIHIVQRNELL